MIIVTGMRVFKRPWKAVLPAVILASRRESSPVLSVNPSGGNPADGGSRRRFYNCIPVATPRRHSRRRRESSPVPSVRRETRPI